MFIEIITKDFGTIISDEISQGEAEMYEAIDCALTNGFGYLSLCVNYKITFIPSSVLQSSIISLTGGKQ